jgi:hypothetical protein
MKILCFIIVLLSSCSAKKPVEWYPRVNVWRNITVCNDSDINNAERNAVKEANFCRLGSGVLISVGRKI